MWRLCLLFLQLCKTSCRTRTDIPHMFFCFSDRFVLIVSILFPCLSHICHCSTSHPSPLCLSPSQTWLITWQWTTSSSRSSCWLLAWPQLESEASPHQLLLCGGATWCRHSQWCSLCSCFVITDQWILQARITFSPFNRNWGTGETFRNFCSQCKVQWLIKGAVYNKRCYISYWLSKKLFCLIQNHWMFSTTYQSTPDKPMHCVNRKLALWSTPTMVIWTFVASCLTSCLLSYWLCVITRVPSSLDSFVIGLISGSYLGEQTHKRLLLLSLMAVNDLMPGLHSSLLPEAEVKTYFKMHCNLKCSVTT